MTSDVPPSESGEQRPQLLLVSADLMLGSLANGHAKSAGFDVRRCLSETKAFQILASESFPVVVLELGMPDLQIAKIRDAAGAAVVVGFAGHVRTDLLSTAETAGITVVTNGQLHAQGESILRTIRDRLKSSSEASPVD